MAAAAAAVVGGGCADSGFIGRRVAGRGGGVRVQVTVAATRLVALGVMGGRDSDDRGGGMMALEKIDDDVGGYLV